MADGNWERVTGDDRRDLERQHDRGGGDIGGYRRTEEAREEREEGHKNITRIEIYSQLAYAGVAPPAPDDVIQRCDKCGEHIDAVTNAKFEPVAIHYEPAHVNAGQWGSRNGRLFRSVTVTGTVLRRIETWTEWSDGQTMHRQVRWERRDINHVENRPWIEWGPMSAVSCAHGVEEGSISLHGQENAFVLAMAQADVLRPFTLADDSDATSHLVKTSRTLSHPIVRVRASGKTVTAVLSNAPAGETPREVGQLDMEIEPESSILSIVRWKDRS